jgi:hypothetical protein
MKLLNLTLVVFPFIAACSLSPRNIQSKQSTDLGARHIRRIAVVMPTAPLPAAPDKSPLLGVPSEKTPELQHPGEMLMRLVYSAMVGMPTWQIVSDSEVSDLAQSVAPSNDMARIRKIGELVYADAVLTGRVLRYRERVGSEIGVKSPASVAFTVDLIDVRRGDVVWSARFDETQKGLTENILSLGDIRERGIRWLTAEQLAQDGVRKVINQLHQAIVRSSGS